LQHRADHEADQATRNEQACLARRQMPWLGHVVNDVGGVERVIAVKENHQADEQGKKAVVTADRGVGDFLADVDHARRTWARETGNAEKDLDRSISACRTVYMPVSMNLNVFSLNALRVKSSKAGGVSEGRSALYPKLGSLLTACKGRLTPSFARTANESAIACPRPFGLLVSKSCSPEQSCTGHSIDSTFPECIICPVSKI
jgi:hypothetical protein